MKRLISILLCLLLAAPAALAAGVEVVVGGEPLRADAEAEIVNSRAFVPLRAIAEELDADVEWVQELMEVRLSKGKQRAVLTIGQTAATVSDNGIDRSVTLEAAPYIKEGRTFVPLRFIAQGLGGGVAWYDDLKTAVIVPPYGSAKGAMAEMLKQYLTVSLPNAIKLDSAELAEDIEDDPEKLIAYFSNLWTDLALERLAGSMSEAEREKFMDIDDDGERYDYLAELAEDGGFPLDCPVKMCAVDNNGGRAVIMAAPADRTAELITQYILRERDGAPVADPVQ